MSLQKSPPSLSSTAAAAVNQKSFIDDAETKRRQSAPDASSASELARTEISLRAALREFPDFPIPGVNFVDILPLFANHTLHKKLIRALEIQVRSIYVVEIPDVIVGLDARGFLFGPSLALALGAGFAPVRKRGKLPGPTAEASFQKEYGQDYFHIQKDAIKPGQLVLVVDDIIATGGSAAAAGELVEKCGGRVAGYLFMLELDFLKGRDKLNARVTTLLRDDKGCGSIADNSRTS